VAFHAAHLPWHVPPAALHTTGVTESNSDEEKFHAMIEAMDTEIGRLLVSIDPAVMENTVVVFLGDNGSQNDFVPASWDPSAGKGWPYESGINVPLIIQTPKTIGRGWQSEVMVHAADLLPTFAELAGADVSRFVTTTGHWDAAAAAHAVGADMPWEANLAALSDGVLLDGASFAEAIEIIGATGPREYVYVERFMGNGPPPYSPDRRAVHDGRYKLTDMDGVYGLHDLQGRHDDGPNLLSGPLVPVERAAFERLSAVLEVHRKTLVFDP
jgi:arylsulfatase A-like enzyme